MKHGTQVEFLSSGACRVLAPVDSGTPRTVNVPKGIEGVITETWDCLPGDVGVLIVLPIDGEEKNLAVSARIGMLASFEIEHDSMGVPMFRRYRGTRVPIVPEEFDV